MPDVKPASAYSKKRKQGHGGGKTLAPEIQPAGNFRLDGVSLAFALLLFCSGTAALIFQILWIRQLSLVFGVDVFSITIAVSPFFAGLAAGSVLLGRIAESMEAAAAVLFSFWRVALRSPQLRLHACSPMQQRRS